MAPPLVPSVTTAPPTPTTPATPVIATPLPWSSSPASSVVPSQSQDQLPRHLNEREVVQLVQLAVRHADVRQRGMTEFYNTVRDAFFRATGRHFPSVNRKLPALAEYWRREFDNRGSETGQEWETELVQAMRQWIKVLDDEARIATARGEAVAAAQRANIASATERDNMMRRLRDKEPIGGL